MSDQNEEEQQMEAEALAAIFDEAFEVLSVHPHKWSVKLVPIDTGGDPDEDAKQNHVAVKLIVTLPSKYPEEEGPKLDIQVLKGLADDQRKEILQLAEEEAEANAGMPVVFSVSEVVRTWLSDNNVKGQDDGSMYAQMIKKAKEAERKKAKAEIKFESQQQQDTMTATEIEEEAVRKRRAEGTPCNEENFYAWKKSFELAMAAMSESATDAIEKENLKKKEKKEDVSGRITGFEHFSGKGGMLNLEAIEAAAMLEDHVDSLEINEELFEGDDDLDDLDFDDNDDSESNSSEDDGDPDI